MKIFHSYLSIYGQHLPECKHQKSPKWTSRSDFPIAHLVEDCAGLACAHGRTLAQMLRGLWAVEMALELEEQQTRIFFVDGLLWL